jgi:hypothetical protein
MEVPHHRIWLRVFRELPWNSLPKDKSIMAEPVTASTVTSILSVQNDAISVTNVDLYAISHWTKAQENANHGTPPIVRPGTNHALTAALWSILPSPSPPDAVYLPASRTDLHLLRIRCHTLAVAVCHSAFDTILATEMRTDGSTASKRSCARMEMLTDTPASNPYDVFAQEG